MPEMILTVFPYLTSLRWITVSLFPVKYCTLAIIPTILHFYQQKYFTGVIDSAENDGDNIFLV